MRMPKVIAATQRDKWEDHCHLFKAVVSGSMTLTDRVLSLPHGLESGASAAECDSAEDLSSKIRCCTSHPEKQIEIARKGREVAMKQRLTWCRSEEIALKGCRPQAGAAALPSPALSAAGGAP